MNTRLSTKHRDISPDRAKILTGDTFGITKVEITRIGTVQVDARVEVSDEGLTVHRNLRCIDIG